MSGAIEGLGTVFCVSPFESSFATSTTPDRFLEIVSEGLERRHIQLQSNGLKGGARNLRRGVRRAVSGRDAGGDVTFEVATTGFGRIWELLLGGAPTITSLGGSPTAYSHVYNMASLLGRSVTVQKQLYDSAQNLIQKFTYPGTKVTQAEFTVAVQQFLLLKLTLDSQDEVTATAAAAASYTTQKLFNFSQATLKIAGSTVAHVSAATLTLNNELKTDNRYLGNQGLKEEQTDNGFPTLTGSLTAEVLASTLYDLFAADTAVAFQLVFVGDTISGANPASLTIDVPEIHLTGKTPSVSGPGVVEVQTPFEAATDAAGDAGMKITYVTADATA